LRQLQHQRSAKGDQERRDKGGDQEAQRLFGMTMRQRSGSEREPDIFPENNALIRFCPNLFSFPLCPKAERI
jgi:hypothetical protein